MAHPSFPWACQCSTWGYVHWMHLDMGEVALCFLWSPQRFWIYFRHSITIVMAFDDGPFAPAAPEDGDSHSES